jgi:hypothetical protein
MSNTLAYFVQIINCASIFKTFEFVKELYVKLHINSRLGSKCLSESTALAYFTQIITYIIF